jgi:hypothetical protein
MQKKNVSASLLLWEFTEVRGDDELGLLAEAHLDDALIPSSDDLHAECIRQIYVKQNCTNISSCEFRL